MEDLLAWIRNVMNVIFFFFFLDDDDFWKFHFEFDDRSGYFLGFECNYFE